MGTPTTEQTPPKQEQVNWEQRYKDLQSHTTKVSQQNAALRAEAAAVKSVLPEVIKPALTDQDQERLANLLEADPEAWRQEYNSLEQKAYQQAQERIESTKEKLTAEETLKLRDQALTQFMADPGTTLTPDDLDKIPVGLVKKLESGEIDFNAYLVEADKSIKAGIGGVTQGTKQPDMEETQGTSQGSSATPSQVTAEYEQMIF